MAVTSPSLRRLPGHDWWFASAAHFTACFSCCVVLKVLYCQLAQPVIAGRMPMPGGHEVKLQVTGRMQRVLWGVQTIVNGNVSQAEDMVADMAESATFRTRLQQAGLGVAHVLLVSCEPLDPEELPVRLRPPRYNVSLPVQGGECPAAISALNKARLRLSMPLQRKCSSGYSSARSWHEDSSLDSTI